MVHGTSCLSMVLSCYQAASAWFCHILRLSGYDTVTSWGCHDMVLSHHEAVTTWYCHIINLLQLATAMSLVSYNMVMSCYVDYKQLQNFIDLQLGYKLVLTTINILIFPPPSSTNYSGSCVNQWMPVSTTYKESTAKRLDHHNYKLMSITSKEAITRKLDHKPEYKWPPSQLTYLITVKLRLFRCCAFLSCNRLTETQTLHEQRLDTTWILYRYYMTLQSTHKLCCEAGSVAEY